MLIKRLFFTIIVLFSFLALSYAEDGRQVVRLNKGAVSEVQYSPDGQILAVASSVGIWLYPTQTEDPPTLIEHPNRISNISFSADGKILAASDHTVSSICGM